ncbi:MAG: Ig-like domain-containing protein [Prevotella sp.]|nr:Ig-like domain-containing protein [Prevotella sp.]
MMFLLHISESFGYSGYVGQTISLPAPAVSGTIDGAAWMSSANNYVSVSGSHYSAEATILQYFTGTVTIDCQYAYSYYIGTKKYYGNSHAYYTITCMPSRLTLSKKEITIGVGDEYELEYSNSTGYTVNAYWETSDNSIASILDGRENGKWLSAQKATIYGKAEGTAIIKCDGFTGETAPTCVVTVKKKVPINISHASGIVEKGTKVTISTPGETGTEIYYTLNGSTPSKNSTRYSSDGIVINSDCTIKAIAYKDNYAESSILSRDYKIAVHATGVKVDLPFKKVLVGEKMTASCSLIPSSANTNNGVSWSSDNVKIATVDSKTGEIKGIAAGTTYIRAKTEKGYSDICKVAVVNPTTISDVKMVACSNVYSASSHAFILQSDGTLWASGSNNCGQLGDGTTTSRNGFVKVMSDVSKVATGARYSLIIKKDGSLWVCGSNNSGQLGDGTTNDCYTPVKIMIDVESVCAGEVHSLIVKKDGSLWTCGSNSDGQLGDGTTTNRKTPIKIMDDVSAVSAGRLTSFILKKDGSLYACGNNSNGQLGDGTLTDRSTPVKIMSDVATMSAGTLHTLFVKKDGSLWGCGNRYAGKLGDGTTYNLKRKTPFKIIDGGIKTVSAGYTHSLAVDDNGALWGCGSNCYGLQEGADPTFFSKVIDTGVKQAEAGHGCSIVVKNDNSIWACGYNYDGMLGLGQENERFMEFVKIHEPLSPSIVTISDTEQSVLSGKSVKLSYKFTDGSTSEKVTWTSDDSSIATVSSDGTVKGIKSGTTFINVIASNGDMDWCKVTVTGTDVKQTVTLSSAGYATFYDADFAYTLPSGLSAQVVTANNSGKLTYKTIASSYGVIPKGVPVILVSNNRTGGTYTLTSSTSSTSYTGSNLLHGSNTQTMTSNVNGVSTYGNSNYVYYKLSYGKSGSVNANKLGWYWGANNGAAFSIAGGKAWLALPKSSAQSMEAMLPLEEDATGIDEIEQNNAIPTEGYLYNMSGQKVGNDYRGVIIRNGKKIIK